MLTNVFDTSESCANETFAMGSWRTLKSIDQCAVFEKPYHVYTARSQHTTILLCERKYTPNLLLHLSSKHELRDFYQWQVRTSLR